MIYDMRMAVKTIMRYGVWLLLVVILFEYCALADTTAAKASDDLSWPSVTQQCRPWARWWWLGGAVDEPNLSMLLEQYQRAGLGGVEICPIYGVKGFERHFVNFLSSRWMKLLAYTTIKADELGLGVDLTCGTGWPFGGPMVTADMSSAAVVMKYYELAVGRKLGEKLPQHLQCLIAVSDDGRQIDLTDSAKKGRLDWTAPAGRWRLYALAEKRQIQKVKRAAPGGEGCVLDPYSVTALDGYLAEFDKAFAGYRGKMPRCFFHDSFEYNGADWTSDFLRQFEFRRGYDLRAQLPALFGDAPADTVARVRSDYRETLSDLHLAYIGHWTQWCHRHGSLSRDQAHGAPANLIDVYAAADIPETETFGQVDQHWIPMIKFAASAAHLNGRNLVSSESFTWLGAHFNVSLADVKRVTDLLFVAGVNHIFFHGIPYSPAQAPWPGWQFYASVNFGPQGGLWRDLPSYNAYVTRCQSVLQSGRAAADDVLLYFPVYDIWDSTGPLLMQFKVHNQQQLIWPTPFGAAAMMLYNRGYTFDEISDRFLLKAQCEDDTICLGKERYRAIVVPQCRLMPAATLQKLVVLARAGAAIVFEKSLPQGVPGFGNLEERRASLQQILGSIKTETDPNSGLQTAAIGRGRILIGPDVETLLKKCGVSRESCVDLGLQFTRRIRPDGFDYFIVNRSAKPFDGWVTLGSPAASAVILDPRYETSAGVAALRRDANGSSQVYLQLQPGESCILRTFTSKTVQGPSWPYVQLCGQARDIQGSWKVEFIEGGPELPPPYQTRQLASWTALDDERAKSFAGTARYTIEFDRPAGDADDWLLDLGRVCESARVSLNGSAVGTLWCPPYRINVGKFLAAGKNTLEVEVTSLAANRIRDMDKRGVNWKYFYDANVVDINYKPFDASHWPLRDSGLLGPVRLQPIKEFQPASQTPTASVSKKIDTLAEPIQPISAPFKMPQLQRPVFPERVFDIRDYGAVADGTTKDTQAFAKAIEACAAAGGGRVLVPAGKWFTGPIHLASNTDLHLAEGAEIIFSDRFEDYLPVVLVRVGGIEIYNYSPFIYARDSNNIAITGPGKLNGNAQKWWAWAGRETNRFFEMSAAGVPVEQRVFGTEADAIRPNFVSFVNCRNVLLEGFTIGGGPNWTIHPTYCENVIIRRLNVVTSGPNNDGIDPDSCKNVLIEHCTFETGDDCVVLKSGYNEDGWRVGKPTENVVMRYCSSKRGHGGLVVGSEMSGDVRNVYMHDCEFEGTDRAVRIKSRRGRGGVVENIWAQNLKVRNMQREVIILNMVYGADTRQAANEKPPVFRNIFIRNVVGDGAPTAVLIRALEDSPVENVRLQDVKIKSTKGIICSNVKDVLFENVNVTPARGPVYTITNGSDVTIESGAVPERTEAFLSVEGKLSNNIKIVDTDLSNVSQAVITGPNVPEGAVTIDKNL
jgi:hypothetical protein